MCKLTVDTSIFACKCDRVKPLVDSLVSETSVESRITADLLLSMATSKDNIILQATIDSGESGFTMANTKVIRQRGRFETYPDKTEIFVWDGKPLIQFQPLEIKQEGLKITVSQPYRLLSR